MNIFRRGVAAVAAFSLMLSLVGPVPVLAATTPSLGQAATYAVLADTYTNTAAGTTINGDIGFTTGPAVVPGGVHTNYGAAAPYATAGIDQGNALTALAAQPCTFTFAPGPIDLSTDITHGPVGVYTPGVYCSTGAMDVSGPLTLSGSGTYIFRPDGALTSTAGAVVSLADASACDIFWTPTAATTLAANTTFFGTVIDDAGITVGANTTWTGRALAFGGTVTTDTDTITAPTCAATPPSSSFSFIGRINVLKTVVNDNGGTMTSADFPLFINGMLVQSGVTNAFLTRGSTYTITETPDDSYTQTFSGDCASDGTVYLNPRDLKFCVVTNDDIGAPVVVPPVPPLIDIVKVPSPLALPNGPGSVTYGYTLRNIGTVPVTNLTVLDDTCAPMQFIAGDVNSNVTLEVNETWSYRCETTLTETHTNTVVATGWANGLSAADIATATVVVSLPVVPPLIHVTKVPSPLTLLAGGGMVTYTEKISNPGTVPLNNVRLVDDKCTPVQYVSGDTNGDLKLDPSETWTYTCQKNLLRTTTNTAIATGEANGLTVRDFAIATVVVASAVPSLPNTGFSGPSALLLWLVLSSGVLVGSLVVYVLRKKQIV